MSARLHLRAVASAAAGAVLLSMTVLPVATYAQTTSMTRLAATAEAALQQLGLSVPATGPITRLQAIEGVESVIGLGPASSATPSYTDVSASTADFGAVEAAVAANLMTGWASTTGTFDPSQPLSRTQLAILATNALGLGAKANGLLTNVALYRYLWDLSRAGYNIGFANAMLEEGVVPPMDNVRYMPNAGVTPAMYAVALYRMWLLYDLPFTTSVAAQDDTVLTGHADDLNDSALNRLGTAIPPVNLARYTLTYAVQGANAGTASVADGVFTASAPGSYTVAASIAGPLLRAPVVAQTTITVNNPAPTVTGPAAATGVIASEVSGGIAVAWNASPNATGYVLLASDDGGPYTAVSSADDGGPLGSGTTFATVTGGLTLGDTYTFEVLAEASGGSSASSASNAVLYGVAPLPAPTASFSDETDDVTITWQAGPANVAQYYVAYSTDGGATWQSLSGLSSYGGAGSYLVGTTQAVLSEYDGALPYSPDGYEFEVEAVDSVGNGAYSPPSAPLFPFNLG